MTLLLLSTVLMGILAGRYLMPVLLVPELGAYAMWLLLLVLVGIGVELGASSSLLERLKRMQPLNLLLPFTSALGSLLGVAVGAMILGVRIPVGLSIGAGFGWYSLSSVLLSEVAGTQIAALAFLTNVVRELIAIPVIPTLVRLNFGVAAITPGGATTMDTTLAIISRVTNEETTLVAFYHGVVLSLLVPVLVTFFARMI
ncbi:MAG: lysine exporter LysO family protein [Bacillota bacterium]|nr:lysine exporter LysO family protein [Bacillota bacterium]